MGLHWIFATLTLISATLWLNSCYYFSSDYLQAPLKQKYNWHKCKKAPLSDHTHTYTHICTHTQVQKHTHTCTQTYSQINIPWYTRIPSACLLCKKRATLKYNSAISFLSVVLFCRVLPLPRKSWPCFSKGMYGLQSFLMWLIQLIYIR